MEQNEKLIFKTNKFFTNAKVAYFPYIRYLTICGKKIFKNFLLTNFF